MSSPLVLHGFTAFLEKVLQEILNRKKGKGNKGHAAGYMNKMTGTKWSNEQKWEDKLEEVTNQNKTEHISQNCTVC